MEDNRKRYPAVCPTCGEIIYVCKSILQEMGAHDMGSGSCIHCKSYMHLTFSEETQRMEAIPFEDWINQGRDEKVVKS